MNNKNQIRIFFGAAAHLRIRPSAQTVMHCRPSYSHIHSNCMVPGNWENDYGHPCERVANKNQGAKPVIRPPLET